MTHDISTEHAMIATQRVMRSFGDLIGGNPQIMERIVFRVITGDCVFESDDDEEERLPSGCTVSHAFLSGEFFFSRGKITRPLCTTPALSLPVVVCTRNYPQGKTGKENSFLLFSLLIVVCTCNYF